MKPHLNWPLMFALCGLAAVSCDNAELDLKQLNQVDGDLNAFKFQQGKDKCNCVNQVYPSEKIKDWRGGGGGNLEKVIEDLAVNAMLRTAPSLVGGCGTPREHPETSHFSAEANYDQKRDVSPEEWCNRIKDCKDVAASGRNKSGVYRVWPDGWSSCGMNVYCDLEKDGGGWTVIQRRGRFGNPIDYFFRTWRSYKFGFGNLSAEFWLGNDKLRTLTNQREYVLRVTLKTHGEGSRYAQYDEFYIDEERENYKLRVNGYTGDASDSLTFHNGMNFSTKDRGNGLGCAVTFKGGWWYALGCHKSNLNGLYLDGDHTTYGNGINWSSWKGFKYSFPDVEMKIRPADQP